MNFTWMDLARYLEVTALVMSLSLLLARALPMPDARDRLRFLYLTLIACLVIPLCAIRHDREVIPQGPVSTAYDSMEVVDTRDGIIFVERPLVTLWRQVGQVPRWILLLASLRILWLCVGLIRLSLYRRRAQLIMPLPEHLREVRTRQRVDAQLYLSNEVNGPMTFGFIRPAVLLPEYFGEISEAQQSAAVCHELAHVRRNDAVTVFLEEVLRSVLWFHPLVWWLLDRIQLCREQVVDAETIAITEDRATYLETLLEFAQRNSLPDLAPAAPFLKRNHLVERMKSIASEVNMPDRIRRLNAFALYTLMPCALALGIWLLPLRGQPQFGKDTPGVTILTPFELMHRPPVELPNDAKASAEVTVNVTVNDSGEVVDANAIAGPRELYDSVVRSVRGWHFDASRAVLPKQFEVKVRFDPNARGSASRASILGPDQVTVSGDQSTQGDWIHARGRCPDACAELNSTGLLIKADEIDYNQSTKDVEARGHVIYQNFKEGKTVNADRVKGQLNEQDGKFDGHLVHGLDFDLHLPLSATPDQTLNRSQTFKITRVDASALPESARQRVLQAIGIHVGDTISQFEAMAKLNSFYATEPTLQFAWHSGDDGTAEIYLQPRDARSHITISPPSSIRITKVDANNLPESLRQRVLERLNIHDGDSISLLELTQKQAALREIDRHLVLSQAPPSPNDPPFEPEHPQFSLKIQFQTSDSPQPAPASVRFASEGPQPIYTVLPLYPPLALQARIQGTVRYAVVIGADGEVRNLQLISGHPLMVPPSTEALKQFKFAPTGSEVKTTASVIFSLRQ